MADPEVKIRVSTTETGGGTSALAKARTEIGQLIGSIPGVGTALGAVGSAAGIVAVAVGTAAKALREFAEAEKGIAGLDAALASMGHLTEDNRGKLQALAGELQSATAIADDQWVGVLTKLVQFGAKPESIGMDVEAVKNLAGVVGDLGTATTLYSKALQGNFEALGRYGMKVKDLEELQRVAAERGGGQLEARARTLGGLFAQLGNTTSDFFEALGQGIAGSGVAQAVLGSLSDVMASLAESIGGTYASLQSYNRETAGAAEALARYKDQAQQVLDLTHQQVAALKAESELLAKKQSLLDQLTDKQAAMDMARVDLQVATGAMSEKDAVKARAGIRYRAAREKIERGRDTEASQLQLQEDAVAALERRKAAVDADLERERKRLVPEEKLAKIQALVRSAAASRMEYGELAQVPAALRSASGYVGLRRVNARAAGEGLNLAVELAQMQGFEEQTLARTTNRATERRGRVSELERMSGELGADITRARGQLDTQRVSTQAGAIGANMDLATARMTEAKDMAQAGSGQLDGATRALAGALSESAALSKSLAAQVDAFRRELANVKAQVKDHANK